jgi:phage tail protein X
MATTTTTTVFQYQTIQGDTFDSISFDLFATEKYMGEIITANRSYTDVVDFAAGVELTIPVVNVTPNLSAVAWGTLTATS